MSNITRTLRVLGVPEDSLEWTLLAAELGAQVADGLFAAVGRDAAQLMSTHTKFPRLAAGTKRRAASVGGAITCVLVGEEQGIPVGTALCEHRHASLYLIGADHFANGQPADELSALRVAGHEHPMPRPVVEDGKATWLLPRSIKRNMLAKLERDNGVAVVTGLFER